MKFVVLTLVASSLLMYSVAGQSSEYVFEAGHESLQEWLLPDEVPAPADNPTTPEKVSLGKMLFFDPRLSGDGDMSCASCHTPLLAWGDGMKTSKAITGEMLSRHAPSIVNAAFNAFHNWDGIRPSLEEQARGVMLSEKEMASDLEGMVAFLRTNETYAEYFNEAFPEEGITVDTTLKAIGAFQRTVVVRDTPFDRWVAGDEDAMTAQQIRGFKLFNDSEKGNCVVCHSAPNFSDDGFHNLGLASYADPNPDLGRYNKVPLGIMKGAFKTPSLRNVEYTSPYFHDGSAKTLDEVMDHYIKGGEVKTNLSPNMKPLTLTESEKQDIIAFMKALSGERQPFELPVLPI